MNPKQAVGLRETWGAKPCDHPRIESIGHSGLEACTECGRIIKRGSDDKPIPSGSSQ